ncbi:MAG: NfeD family protein [Myxococcales bacterium]
MGRIARRFLALWLLVAGLVVLSSVARSSVRMVAAQERDAGAARAEPAPYTPRPSKNEGGKRDIAISASPGAPVVVLHIEGTIDLGLSAYIERALEQHPDAAAFLLDINTLGGRVDAAIQIRDRLLSSKRKTIAFVHPRAISAGALISLACDVIAISSGASIGAATPIQLGEGGAEPVEEKMVSYFRTEMRTTAEARGRRGDIAEAMVDSSVEIPGLDPAGKLLTLDTAGALETGIADFQAESVDAVLERVGVAKAPRQTQAENWAEKLVRFLTDPVVSGLLMSLGTLGILIELYTPGLGLPGALGALCLSLFFGGHLLVNLAGLEELILFAAGLGLLALEVMVLPGFGIAGVLGIVCMVAALVLTLVGLPLGVAFQTGAWVEPLGRVTAALVVTVVLMLLALRILPKSRAGRGLVLSSSTASSEGFVAHDATRLLGQVGVSESELRPAGVARFGSERVDVVSEGAFVARGLAVRVVQVEGVRVVVRPEESGEAG